MKRYAWWKKCGVAIAAILFAFLLLEIATRAFDAYRGRGFFSNSRELYANRGFKPYTMFGFDLYRNVDGERFVLSRHGEAYSFTKKPGTYRVVVFGGSTTENLVAFQASGLHYPKLLEQSLQEAVGKQGTGPKKVEVINVGNSAYTTLHSLILLELNVVSWQPDMIIVSHNVNDLLTSYWPNFSADYSHKYFTSHYLPDFKKKFATHNRLLSNSQFYCAIRPRIQQLFRQDLSIRRRSMGNDPLPTAAMVFERNLKSIVAIARQHGIDVVLGSQPLETSQEMFEEHMSHKKYNDEVVYPEHEEFVNHHKIMNQIIRAVSKDQGCHFVDVASEIAGRREDFVDFVHYTPKGVASVAAAYSDYLLENVLDPGEKP